MPRPFLLSFNIGEFNSVHTEPYCTLTIFVLIRYTITFKTKRKLTVLQTFKNVLVMCCHNLPFETQILTKLISVVKCTSINIGTTGITLTRHSIVVICIDALYVM